MKLIEINRKFFSSFQAGPNLSYRKAKAVGKSMEDFKSYKVIVPGFKGEALYGTFPVLEALSSRRRQIYKLYMKDSVKKRAVDDTRISKILNLSKEFDIPVGRLTQAQFDRKTDFQLHNGVCLDVSTLPFSNFNTECQQLLFLDGILDPGNIGAIARTAFFYGVQNIILRSSRCPLTITPAMSKASCGAIEHMNISKLEDHEITQNLQSFQIVGTVEPSGGSDHTSVLNLNDFKVDKCSKIALVLGDEGTGISPLLKSLCHSLVTITGSQTETSVNSLNVSVATGIFLQHLHLKHKDDMI